MDVDVDMDVLVTQQRHRNRRQATQHKQHRNSTNDDIKCICACASQKPDGTRDSEQNDKERFPDGSSVTATTIKVHKDGLRRCS